MNIYKVKLSFIDLDIMPVIIEKYECLNITNIEGIAEMIKFFAGNLSKEFIEQNLYKNGFLKMYSIAYIDIDFNFTTKRYNRSINYIKNYIIKENRNAKLKMLLDEYL